MNKARLFALAGVATLMGFSLMAADNSSTQNQANSSSVVSSDADHAEMLKLSEAFGHFIGRNLNTPGMNFDLDAIIKGMRDGAAGKAAPMSDQEYETLLMKVQQKAFIELSETNLKAANAFMEENKKQPNINELEPGKLQYTILEEGTGATVGDQNAPLIHYVGKYIDGTSFGNSRESGGPVTIPLDQTIPGFSKGIVGMKEGEKRRLFVHPDLGYGTMGQLPPNSLLIFDVEVIKADNKEALQDPTASGDDMDDDLQSMSESDDDESDDSEE